MEAGAELPRLARGLNLGFCLATFQEQPLGPFPEERRCQLEQTGQGRKRAGADHVRLQALSAFGELFNAHGVNVHRGLGFAHDLGEKRAFLAGCSRRDACGSPARPE